MEILPFNYLLTALKHTVLSFLGLYYSISSKQAFSHLKENSMLHVHFP